VWRDGIPIPEHTVDINIHAPGARLLTIDPHSKVGIQVDLSHHWDLTLPGNYSVRINEADFWFPVNAEYYQSPSNTIRNKTLILDLLNDELADRGVTFFNVVDTEIGTVFDFVRVVHNKSWYNFTLTQGAPKTPLEGYVERFPEFTGRESLKPLIEEL